MADLFLNYVIEKDGYIEVIFTEDKPVLIPQLNEVVELHHPHLENTKYFTVYKIINCVYCDNPYMREKDVYIKEIDN